jgi:PKD repeat protein
VSWDWDLGDGGSSGAQNPSHFFTSAGTYEVWPAGPCQKVPRET